MYKIFTGFELPNVTLDQCESHIALIMQKECSVLSSAVLNGGFTNAKSILNMRVIDNYSGELTGFELPEITLENYGGMKNLPTPTTGMMTSADLKYFQAFTAHHEKSKHRTAVAVTAGLSNARAAGDRAEYCEITDIPLETGTINIILGTTVALSPAAKAEALMIITEAKTALLHLKNEKSRVSSNPATGTGTDSVAVFSPEQGDVVSFCGKHTILGEMIARLVQKALDLALKR